VRARESAAFTAYDGDLGGLDIPSPLARTISPSALELWAGCPYAYFVRHVLGVQPIEQPDVALQITPLDLGTLVHDALDRFHRRVIAGELPQPGPGGWGAQHAAAVDDELRAAGERMAAAGRVGRPAMWASSQADLASQVHRWLVSDSARLVERGATVIASESRFGQSWHPDSAPPVALALPDGRTVQLAGTIDRVDRGADGTLFVVDHKTGSTRSYDGIGEADPMAGGSKLQLPVYAAAALMMIPDGEPAPAVRAEYSFLRDDKLIGASFPAGAWAVVGQVVGRIVDGIDAGLFFAVPARSQHLMSWVECDFCDPDHLGTAERYEEHLRKRTDPRLAPFFPDAGAAPSTTSPGGVDG
jgi:ATP-dependent helicase/nuclease subunit B